MLRPTRRASPAPTASMAAASAATPSSPRYVLFADNTRSEALRRTTDATALPAANVTRERVSVATCGRYNAGGAQSNRTCRCQKIPVKDNFHEAIVARQQRQHTRKCCEVQTRAPVDRSACREQSRDAERGHGTYPMLMHSTRDSGLSASTCSTDATPSTPKSLYDMSSRVTAQLAWRPCPRSCKAVWRGRHTGNVSCRDARGHSRVHGAWRGHVHSHSADARPSAPVEVSLLWATLRSCAARASAW